MKKNILFFLCLVAVNAGAQLPNNIKKPVGNAPVLKTTPSLPAGVVDVTRRVTVRPGTLNNLCPTERIAGDHEFDKNELHIEVSVSYQGDNGRDSVLKARIFISGQERGADRSAVRKAFLVPVYTAPTGFVIKEIIATGRVAAFSFDTKDSERPKPQIAAACTTYLYNLNRASLGFDLDQHMLSGMVINSRNINGADFTESEGSCGCGFRIQSIGFLPFDVVIERKRP